MLGRWIAVFVLVWGCGTESRLSPKVQAHPRASAILPRAPGDDIAARANQIARDIAALRGWDATLDIPIEWVDDRRLAAAILADEDSQITPAVRETQFEFLKAFGWVPAEFDFERDVAARFSHDLLGLYCFTWRHVLLRTRSERSAVDSTLRHELVHAFQDKYFHIGEKVRWQEGQGDRIAALHALAEGEATCIARQLQDPWHRGCLATDDEDLEYRLLEGDGAALPAVIRYALLSPYSDGTRYVRRLLRLGGWPEVDRAWRGNLTATRDLVRELPVGRERPIDIPEAILPRRECVLKYLDVLGAQGLASVLFESLSPADASRWASDLSADRAAYWRCNGACVAAWHVRFASNVATDLIADAIASASGFNQPAGIGAPWCRTTSMGAVSLVAIGRDIAITSVHRCDGEISRSAAISCETANSLADRLVHR